MVSMVFATTRRAFPFSARLLVVQLVDCTWWPTAAGGFECVRPGTLTNEECCNLMYNGKKWNYNYLKQVCRVAFEDGSYFNEEANQCVFADGVECFELSFNTFETPVQGVKSGAYAAWCCNAKHGGDKPYRCRLIARRTVS